MKQKNYSALLCNKGNIELAYKLPGKGGDVIVDMTKKTKYKLPNETIEVHKGPGLLESILRKLRMRKKSTDLKKLK